MLFTYIIGILNAIRFYSDVLTERKEYLDIYIYIGTLPYASCKYETYYRIKNARRKRMQIEYFLY